MILRLEARTRPVLILSILALGGAGPLLLGSRVRAQESKDLVSIQVRLLESGAPLDADLDLVFEVYDQESGGTLLWSETQSGVPVRNGILAARLGNTTPLGSVFKSGLGGSTDRWVAIKEDGSEIVPRVFLTAVPYAHGASAADIASAIWNQATGTALAITDIPAAIVGPGLEASSGVLRVSTVAAGNGLTGGGGSPLAVGAGEGITVTADAVAVNAPGIDGDRLGVDYVPSNYTRSTSGTEAQVNGELAAHLKGIDNALAGGGGGGAGSILPQTAGGRLTLDDADSVTTADVTTTTLYYVRHIGDRVATYSGSTWIESIIPSSGVTLAVSSFPSGGVAGKNYDIFGYDNSGSLALEAVAWTDGTNRATSLAPQDGVWVKSGATTRRYLGTVRLNGSTLLEDSSQRRFIWNTQNRVRRVSRQNDTTSSWTYSASAVAPMNNGDSRWVVELVVGGVQDEDPVEVFVGAMPAGGSGASWCRVGVGVDQTSSPYTYASAGAPQIRNVAASGTIDGLKASFRDRIGIGYHTVRALHNGDGTGYTLTWYANFPDASFVVVSNQ